MNKILLIDTPLIAAWVYPEKKIVHHQMKAFCYGRDFRDALTKIADAMERHGAIKYLSDNQAGGAVPREDEEWSAKHWFPRAQAVGWRHWALVHPVTVIGQINVKRHATNSQAFSWLNARVFGDPVEAMKWLESV